MISTVKTMLACLAIMGMVSSAVAATDNTGGTGEPQAQGQQGSLGQRGNRPGPGRTCHADVEKFCQGVKPGEGRIVACLKKNASGLSSECSEMLARAFERQGQRHEEGGEQKED